MEKTIKISDESILEYAYLTTPEQYKDIDIVAEEFNLDKETKQEVANFIKNTKGLIKFTGKFFDWKEDDELEEYIGKVEGVWKFGYNAYPGGDGTQLVLSNIKIDGAEEVYDNSGEKAKNGANIGGVGKKPKTVRSIFEEEEYEYKNGGGVEGGKHYIVKNIKYDVDRKTQSKLPKELKIIVPNDVQGYEDIEYYISEEISNQTGYAHEGFDTVPEIEEYAKGSTIDGGVGRFRKLSSRLGISKNKYEKGEYVDDNLLEKDGYETGYSNGLVTTFVNKENGNRIVVSFLPSYVDWKVGNSLAYLKVLMVSKDKNEIEDYLEGIDYGRKLVRSKEDYESALKSGHSVENKYAKGSTVKDNRMNERTRAVILKIQKTGIHPDDVSPNFVSEVADENGINLSSKEVVFISDNYSKKFGNCGGVGKKPKMVRTIFEDEEYEYGTGGKTSGFTYSIGGL